MGEILQTVESVRERKKRKGERQKGVGQGDEKGGEIERPWEREMRKEEIQRERVRKRDEKELK